MDSQGFVSLVVISRFNRVRALTQDLSLIKLSLGDSTFLEMAEDKIRRRGSWEQWLQAPVPPAPGSRLHNDTTVIVCIGLVIWFITSYK